ncbi:hypothetical protein C8Q76DRAFT_437689 [Earliella scabrosa]|nr:hypothetical protein C8Q76DRAFT_437689 [Earliella scabrosa]
MSAAEGAVLLSLLALLALPRSSCPSCPSLPSKSQTFSSFLALAMADRYAGHGGGSNLRTRVASGCLRVVVPVTQGEPKRHSGGERVQRIRRFDVRRSTFNRSYVQRSKVNVQVPVGVRACVRWSTPIVPLPPWETSVRTNRSSDLCLARECCGDPGVMGREYLTGMKS